MNYADIESDRVFHRALADAEMTAKLILKIVSEIQRSHTITEVRYELLQQLQRIPKNEVEAWLRRFC